MVGFLMALVFSGISYGATPVLHVGENPQILLAKSAAATTRPADELKVLTIQELVRGKPAVLLGGGRVESCFGPPTSDLNVREAVDRVERALAYLEYEKAMAHIQVGEEAIRCLSSPADAQRIARLYFLKGFVSFEEGEESVVQAAFDVALTIDPDLVWDEYFAPNAKPIFDDVGKQIEGRSNTTIGLLPAPASGHVWIDGRRVSVTDGNITLSEGRHLVQVKGQNMRSHWVTVRAEAAPPAPELSPVVESSEDTPVVESSEDPPEQPEATVTAAPVAVQSGPRLIVPTALTSNAIKWSADPTKRADFDQILSVLYDPDTLVYFSVDGQIIAHPVGSEEWIDLKIPTGFARGGVAGRLVAGRSIMWTGAAATGGALILATSSWAQANSASRGADGSGGWMAYNREKIEYEGAADRMVIARWALLGGALLSGGGLALQYDNLPFLKGKKAQASLVPMAGPDGAGATIVVDAW
jgi:hypothetical protein